MMGRNALKNFMVRYESREICKKEGEKIIPAIQRTVTLDSFYNRKSIPTILENLFSETPKEKNYADLVLDTLFPPLQYHEDGKIFERIANRSHADRIDALQLKRKLDVQLLERRAKEIGICPIRYELILQCFDELIRQIAISCPERALLIVKIKDEICLTISAYETLLEATNSFTCRKILLAEQITGNREEALSELKSKNTILNTKVSQLKRRLSELQMKENEKFQITHRKHQQELEYLKQQLMYLENVLATHANPRNIGKKDTNKI